MRIEGPFFFRLIERDKMPIGYSDLLMEPPFRIFAKMLILRSRVSVTTREK